MRGTAVQIAAVLAGALVVASLATGLLGTDAVPPTEPSDDAPEAVAATPAQAAPEDHDADEHDHADDTAFGSGYDSPALEAAQPRHDFALDAGEGSVPSRAEASELPHQLSTFTVEGDAGLAEMVDGGYVTGDGTLEDPYVIEGFRVTEDLTIKDTSSPLVIRNSYIEGQLTLNFVGEDVHVHHNHVYDLRVNENVQRDGPTTSGLFEHNEILFIGQLRHFGGTFAHNDVGPRPDGVITRYLSDTGPADLPEDIVWNFDGYHLAHVHNNTVIGQVDAKLHGHFHGSCSTCVHHDHAEPAAFPEDNQRPDGGDPVSEHSYRFHTLDFENNTIRADTSGVGLRFYDEAHAGDDQTANSEPNAHLEDRHEHHQFLRVAHNRIQDGALVFDIVNAEDEDRHHGLTQEALVHLVANEVVQDTPRGEDAFRAAYRVHAADTLQLVARGNAFTFESSSSSTPSGYRWVTQGEPGETTGFLLDDVDASAVQIARTTGQGGHYGVTLSTVADDTPVRLEDNRFNAKEEDRHHA